MTRRDHHAGWSVLADAAISPSSIDLASSMSPLRAHVLTPLRSISQPDCVMAISHIVVVSIRVVITSPRRPCKESARSFGRIVKLVVGCNVHLSVIPSFAKKSRLGFQFSLRFHHSPTRTNALPWSVKAATVRNGLKGSVAVARGA